MKMHVYKVSLYYYTKASLKGKLCQAKSFPKRQFHSPNMSNTASVPPSSLDEGADKKKSIEIYAHRVYW